MASPFFDVFLPSVAGSAARGATGLSEALLAAPDIAYNRMLRRAQALWMQNRHAAGGSGGAQMQTLRLLADTNPQLFSQLMADPAFVWQLTTHSNKDLLEAKTQTEAKRGETEAERLTNLKKMGTLIGSREAEVRGRVENQRALTAGRLGMLRDQAQLLTAKILDLQNTGELRRDFLATQIAEMGLTGGARRGVLAETAKLLRDRGNLVAAQTVTEMLRQDTETSRETLLGARTADVQEQTRERQALHQYKIGQAATMVDLYKRRVERLEQELKFAEEADPQRYEKIKAQVIHERAMSEYWREREKYAKEQVKQGPKGASTVPTIIIRPDIIGKPQVQQTFKGPQAEKFNEAYQFWRNALAEAQTDLEQASNIRRNFYRLNHEIPVKSAFEQAWMELFGTAR